MLIATFPRPIEMPRATLHFDPSRMNYGNWSSSGDVFSAAGLSKSPSASGQSALRDQRMNDLRLVVERFGEIALFAEDEGIALQTGVSERAASLLANFHYRIAPLSPNAPHITWSAEGEVVLEWRHEQKQLVFYMDTHSTTYLKAWGSNIYHEMEEGEVFSMREVYNLWQWLNQ